MRAFAMIWRLRRSVSCCLVLLFLPLGAAEANPSGAIVGRVTDEDGTPLPWITVSLEHRGGSWVKGEATDSDGTYRIDGIVDGDYVVHFHDGGGTFASEWWDDEPTSHRADPIAIMDGAEVSGIDAVLARKGTISGVVLDGSTSQPATACVHASAIDEEIGGGMAHTRSDGRFEIRLRPGLYTIRFEDCGIEPRLLPEWYDDARSLDQVTVIEALPGETTTGVDAILLPGGAINGTVTDGGGTPLGDVCVEAHDDSGGYWQVSTSDSGDYHLGPLPDGGYRLRFLDCGGRGLLEQWFSGKDDFEAADPVHLEDGGTVEGIDVVLLEGGAIAGELSRTSGGVPEDACAFVYDLDQRYVAQAATDASGRYRVRGLRSGDYKVRFGSCDHPFRLEAEWWDDQPDFASASVVHVVAGSTLDGIDARLDAYAQIRGRIFSLHGSIEGWCTVAVYSASGGYVGQESYWTGAPYVVTVPSGGYKLRTVCDGNYLPVWFDGADTIQDATIVTVAEGETRDDVNFTVCDPSIDTDADGLTDCREHRLGTDRTQPDSDLDGLVDGDEVDGHGTDPRDRDTDNDAFSDGVEVHGGSCAGAPTLHPSNPRDARSTPYTDLNYGFGQGPVEPPIIC